ncbi:hypothetical protein [Paenibacillus protaetiae]|uniref:Uncharacterized protein n=1 Tax=Paenibacillus protaetiae TaxID=2509456 RepID=A0A4P6EW44_9BACL|nr:hypothetical protein [Paenibacillus protaetiae]QAY66896.1 hypothetical protein ET464_11320 [Paenibacillus protaetiae]
MSEKILPLDDFLQLSADEQVEKLKRWKMDYTLKDIREAWNFKHSAQYYMLLKKLRIYERVVNKSDKFYPVNDPAAQTGSGREAAWNRGYSPSGKLPEDRFSYQLNTTLSGPELADRLERLANFLNGESKQMTIHLSIEPSSLEEDGQEEPENG